MAWVGVIYYGKCDYSILINCILHCVKGKFNQNYFKIFTFLLIWVKNFGSLTGLPIAKPLSLRPWPSQKFDWLQVSRKFYFMKFSEILISWKTYKIKIGKWFQLTKSYSQDKSNWKGYAIILVISINTKSYFHNKSNWRGYYIFW